MNSHGGQHISAEQLSKKILGVLIFPLCCMLFVVVFPIESGRRGSTQNPDKSNEATISAEVHEFRLDCGRYPSDAEGLAALSVAPISLREVWKGPYLTQPIPIDSWGRPYIYRQNGDGFEIITYGSDGVPGGIDDAADVVDAE